MRSKTGRFHSARSRTPVRDLLVSNSDNDKDEYKGEIMILCNHRKYLAKFSFDNVYSPAHSTEKDAI